LKKPKRQQEYCLPKLNNYILDKNNGFLEKAVKKHEQDKGLRQE